MQQCNFLKSMVISWQQLTFDRNLLGSHAVQIQVNQTQLIRSKTLINVDQG